jgi:hypothetical protein
MLIDRGEKDLRTDCACRQCDAARGGLLDRRTLQILSDEIQLELDRKFIVGTTDECGHLFLGKLSPGCQIYRETDRPR